MAKAEGKACRGYRQSLSPGSILVPRNLIRKVEPQFYYLRICLVASFSAACMHVVCIVARSSAACMHVEVWKSLLKRIVISTVETVDDQDGSNLLPVLQVETHLQDFMLNRTEFPEVHWNYFTVYSGNLWKIIVFRRNFSVVWIPACLRDPRRTEMTVCIWFSLPSKAKLML